METENFVRSYERPCKVWKNGRGLSQEKNKTKDTHKQ